MTPRHTFTLLVTTAGVIFLLSQGDPVPLTAAGSWPTERAAGVTNGPADQTLSIHSGVAAHRSGEERAAQSGTCLACNTGTCDGQIGVQGAFIQECGEGSWTGMAFPFETGGAMIDTVRFTLNTNSAGGDVYITGDTGACQPDVGNILAAMCCPLEGLTPEVEHELRFIPVATSPVAPTWMVFVSRTGRAGQDKAGIFDGSVTPAHRVALDLASPSLPGRAFANLVGSGNSGDWQDLDEFSLGQCYCVDLLYTGAPADVFNCASVPTGACCNDFGGCSDGLRGFECGISGGTYQGDGTLCVEVECLPAPGLIATGADPSIDGHLDITIDAYGSWYSSDFGGQGDHFNPVGSFDLQETAFSSGTFLFVSQTQRELLSDSADWQASGDIGADDTLAREITAELVLSDDNNDGVNDTALSSFRVFGGDTDLSFDLTQHVESIGALAAAVLMQDYTITNDGALPVDFVLVRTFDGDLTWVGDVGDDSAGTGTNGSPQERYVFEQEAGTPVTAITLSSAQGDAYFGGKTDIDPDGPEGDPPYGFGTDVQIWNAFGIPDSWRNHIAGVGYSTDGESGASPVGCGSPCDAAIGLDIPVSLEPGASTTITVRHTYGSNSPNPECIIDADCDDGNPCTDDACLDAVCVLTSNSEPCNDADPCTENDVCSRDLCSGTAIDCNENGIADCDDIANQTSSDCNNNGTPDECDLDPLDPDGDGEVSGDCNKNEIPDECDIADCPPDTPSCDDCNINDILDGCDVDPGDPDGNGQVSNDEDEDGVPDECVEPTVPGSWSGDIWGLGGDYPDNDPKNPSGVPDLSVTLDGLTVFVDVTVQIPSLRLLNAASLDVTQDGEQGDLTIFDPTGVFDGNLLIEGTLHIDGEREIDAAGTLTVGTGGVYKSIFGFTGSNSGDLMADRIIVKCGGTLSLSGTMTLSTPGELTLQASDGKGDCTPPDFEVGDDSTAAVGGDFNIQGPAYIDYTSSQPLILGGNFDNQSTDAEIFNWSSGGMTLNGPLHTIEAAGEDRGPWPAGLVNNFAIGTLTLAAESFVQVVDVSDNQQDGVIACDEALYVGLLEVGANATLLTEGCPLYYGQLINNGSIPGLRVSVLEILESAPADFNGDGIVDAFDLAFLLGSWGDCSEPCTPGEPAATCTTDLNGDCETEAFDLAFLLGSWG